MRLSDIDTVSSITDMDYFVGVRNNGDGTYNDYRFTPADITALLKKKITVGSGGTTLTDAFFSNTISEIVTGGQAYITGVDFTQSGTTITGVTISFFTGQVLIAKI